MSVCICAVSRCLVYAYRQCDGWMGVYSQQVGCVCVYKEKECVSECTESRCGSVHSNNWGGSEQAFRSRDSFMSLEGHGSDSQVFSQDSF